MGRLLLDVMNCADQKGYIYYRGFARLGLESSACFVREQEAKVKVMLDLLVAVVSSRVLFFERYKCTSSVIFFSVFSASDHRRQDW